MWRFSLQDPLTNRRRGFATLEALMLSLHAELAGEKADPDPQGPEYSQRRGKGERE